MMELRKILKEHKLGFERFAELIGAGVKTLYKYEKGDETLSEKSKIKIEHGLRVLENCNIIWPDVPSCNFNIGWNYMHRQSEYWKNVKECNTEFRKLL